MKNNNKTILYNSFRFIFCLAFVWWATGTAQAQQMSAGQSLEYSSSTDAGTSTNLPFKPTKAGYYYIEAWGGNGASGTTTMSGSATGGSGGSGAKKTLMRYFSVGDVLNVQVGLQGNGRTAGTGKWFGSGGTGGVGGTKGSSSAADYLNGGNGGGGGSASGILLNGTADSNIILAAAGGGGGGGNARQKSGLSGSAGSDANHSAPTGAGNTTYSSNGATGINGTNGTSTYWGGGGAGGGGGGGYSLGGFGAPGGTRFSALTPADNSVGGGAGGGMNYVNGNISYSSYVSHSARPDAAGDNGYVYITYLGNQVSKVSDIAMPSAICGTNYQIPVAPGTVESYDSYGVVAGSGVWQLSTTSNFASSIITLSGATPNITSAYNNYYIRYRYTSRVTGGYVYSSVVQIKFIDCSCANNGTVLFLEDFGGDAQGDPDVKPITNHPKVGRYLDGTTTLQPAPVAGTSLAGGYYKITKTLIDHNGNWHNFTSDASSPHGYMMAINAAGDGAVFYEMKINGLCGGKKLFFSAKIANMIINPLVEPSLKFQLFNASNNALLETYETGEISFSSTVNWKNYVFPFTVPAGVTSIICKITDKQICYDANGNIAGDCNGNDFALDDIKVSLCLPATIITTAAPTAPGDCTGYTLKGKFTNDGSITGTLIARWEYSTTGNIHNPAAWSVVSGTEKNPYTSGTEHACVATQTGYYRMVVSDATDINNYNCRSMSSTVYYTSAGLAVPVATTPQNLCAGSTVANLLATGIGTMKWYTDASGGSALPTGTLLSAGTYYVSQAVGICESDRIAVSVTIKPSATIQNFATTICSNSEFSSAGNPAIYNFPNSGIQSVTLQPGEYRIEAWGAKGGGSTSGTGLGGYSYGTYTVTSPTNLCIAVGGTGSLGGLAGGYNGGGAGAIGGTNPGYGGGGATHIATSYGLLGSILRSSVLMVAGGGGGAGGNGDSANGGNGGNGGGTSASAGSASSDTYLRSNGGNGANTGMPGSGGTIFNDANLGMHSSTAKTGGGGGGGGGWYGGGGGAGGSCYALSIGNTVNSGTNGISGNVGTGGNGGNGYAATSSNRNGIGGGGGGAGSGYVNMQMLTSALTTTASTSNPGAPNGFVRITESGSSFVGTIPNGTVYSWGTPTVLSGSVTGYNTGGVNAGKFSTGTLINTGTGIAELEYIVTPTSDGCIGQPFKVTVTVRELPTAPTGITADRNPVCSGAPVTLTVTGGSGTYEWGTGACGSNIISGKSGATITVNPIENTTYWVRSAGSSPCNAVKSGCVTLAVSTDFAKPVITNPLENDVTACGSTTLQGQYTNDGMYGTNLVSRWEFSETGTSSWTLENYSEQAFTLAVGATHTSNYIASKSGYYRFVVSTDDNIEMGCRAISRVVKYIATNYQIELDCPKKEDAYIETCDAVYPLRASYSDNGVLGNNLKYYWIYSETGNTQIATEWKKLNYTEGSTSNSIINTEPFLADTTGYYRLVVERNDGSGCVVKSNPAIQIMFLTPPLLEVTNPPAVPYGQTVDITNPALISTNGTVSGYYYDANGRNPLALSDAQTISTTGIYYIEATMYGCSTIKPMLVTIMPDPLGASLKTNSQIAGTFFGGPFVPDKEVSGKISGRTCYNVNDDEIFGAHTYTFVNNSGAAVSMVSYYIEDPSNCIDPMFTPKQKSLVSGSLPNGASYSFDITFKDVVPAGAAVNLFVIYYTGTEFVKVRVTINFQSTACPVDIDNPVKPDCPTLNVTSNASATPVTVTNDYTLSISVGGGNAGNKIDWFVNDVKQTSSANSKAFTFSKAGKVPGFYEVKAMVFSGCNCDLKMQTFYLYVPLSEVAKTSVKVTYGTLSSTTGGNFTKPASLPFNIKVWGGGGGSGRAGADGYALFHTRDGVAGAGGGGGGGYAQGTIAAVYSGNVDITVGSGGTGIVADPGGTGKQYAGNGTQSKTAWQSNAMTIIGEGGSGGQSASAYRTTDFGNGSAGGNYGGTGTSFGERGAYGGNGEAICSNKLGEWATGGYGGHSYNGGERIYGPRHQIYNSALVNLNKEGYNGNFPGGGAAGAMAIKTYDLFDIFGWWSPPERAKGGNGANGSVTVEFEYERPKEFYLISPTLGGGMLSVDNTFHTAVTLEIFPVNNQPNISFQWYKNGTLIPGATNQTYTVTAAGKYKVRVMHNGNLPSTVVFNGAANIDLLSNGDSSNKSGTTLTIGNVRNEYWSQEITFNP